eukprot:TRINITY_DN17273_c0_g1_i1.p1 TRINITY_DN17273_c0_g1~~TRINITY_DN17273_c0_g1_i1.p1  ORF type:complete len:151 (+),score=34.19 TRINITY_DN17273_c0_g1_i1:58-453(+)
MDKKYFTRVSRLICKNIEGNIDLQLDINTEIFPMKEGDKFSLSISKSLTSTGDEGVYDQGDEKNMELDKFHYVMYGKIFRYEEEHKQLTITASFGGLIMIIKSNEKDTSEKKSSLKDLHLDSRIYLLIKRL